MCNCVDLNVKSKNRIWNIIGCHWKSYVRNCSCILNNTTKFHLLFSSPNYWDEEKIIFTNKIECWNIEVHTSEIKFLCYYYYCYYNLYSQDKISPLWKRSDSLRCTMQTCIVSKWQRIQIHRSSPFVAIHHMAVYLHALQPSYDRIHCCDTFMYGVNWFYCAKPKCAIYCYFYLFTIAYFQFSY